MKVIDSSCHVEGIGNVRYEVHIDMRGLRRQTERQQRLRIKELHCVIRRWRAIALLLATVLAASILVIVLQLNKLP